MYKLFLLALLTLPITASCPMSVNCNYHNVYYVQKVRTEYQNGKEFGVYEHTYTNSQGRRLVCRLLVECSR